MDLGLKGKVAIVTGGSKGIGLHTATILVKEGADVAICARTQQSISEALAYIQRETGKEVFGIIADISTKEQCQQVIEKTVQKYGKINILINNAGKSAAKSFENLAFEEWTSDLDLKLFAAIHCSQFALPYLKQQDGGAIVNLNAVLAKTPPEASLPTTVSRSAGLAVTKAMSKDLGKYNIRVNAVCIGLIRSSQIEKRWQTTMPGEPWEAYSKEVGKTIPLGRIGETDEAAKAIVFLASEAASYITGTAINIDGGSGGTL